MRREYGAVREVYSRGPYEMILNSWGFRDGMARREDNYI
jgi:hypothetical protein